MVEAVPVVKARGRARVCVVPAVKVVVTADSVVHQAVKAVPHKVALLAAPKVASVLRVVLAALVESVRKADLPAVDRVVLVAPAAECAVVRAG